jgi:hypothetical protein
VEKRKFKMLYSVLLKNYMGTIRNKSSYGWCTGLTRCLYRRWSSTFVSPSPRTECPMFTRQRKYATHRWQHKISVS